MPKIIVEIMPKQDLLDPQGKAVANALKRAGNDIETTRIGKRIELHYKNQPTEKDLEKAKELARDFLSNSVIEDVVDVYIEEQN
ncbi:MAG TPA: phosphoribosylformylglycinamidine synthase subunit PurS [Microbacteriaceae bacterium]